MSQKENIKQKNTGPVVPTKLSVAQKTVDNDNNNEKQESRVVYSTKVMKTYSILKCTGGSSLQPGCQAAPYIEDIDRTGNERTSWTSMKVSEHWNRMSFALGGDLNSSLKTRRLSPLHPARSLIGVVKFNTSWGDQRLPSTLQEFGMALIDVGVRPDGIIESTLLSRQRLGLADQSPSDLESQQNEVLILLAEGSHNRELGEAILSIRSGRSVNCTAPLRDANGYSAVGVVNLQGCLSVGHPNVKHTTLHCKHSVILEPCLYFTVSGVGGHPWNIHVIRQPTSTGCHDPPETKATRSNTKRSQALSWALSTY